MSSSGSSDSAIAMHELAQYERYIASSLSPLVTGYIMENTALWLPSALPSAGSTTLRLETLPPLTPEYVQRYTYFILRLEGVIRGLRSLEVESEEEKRRERVVRRVIAQRHWLERKMRERLNHEEYELRRNEDRNVKQAGSTAKYGGEQKRHDKHTYKMSRSEPHDTDTHDTSANTNIPTPLGDEAAQILESSIRALLQADDDLLDTKFAQWDAERSASPFPGEPTTPTPTPTPRDREKPQKALQERTLEKFLAAGMTPLHGYIPQTPDERRTFEGTPYSWKRTTPTPNPAASIDPTPSKETTPSTLAAESKGPDTESGGTRTAQLHTHMEDWHSQASGTAPNLHPPRKRKRGAPKLLAEGGERRS